MNIFFIAIGIILFIYILKIVIKGTFDISESILWIFGTIIMLFLSIFPKSIDKISNYLGVDYPPSLLFLIVVIFLVFINFRNTRKIVDLKEKVIDLSQEMAILNEKISREDK